MTAHKIVDFILFCLHAREGCSWMFWLIMRSSHLLDSLVDCHVFTNISYCRVDSRVDIVFHATIDIDVHQGKNGES
jgi:hypothetical protein